MGELTPLDVVVLCLAATGAGVLVHLGLVAAGDRYAVMVMPWRFWPRVLRVFPVWFAPGSEVYHPDLGRCEVARLDRTPDLAMTWVCVQPLDEELPGWVPLTELGETPEEAERLDDLDDPNGGGV